MVSFEFFVRFAGLLLGLMVLGSLLCLPLYGWRVREFLSTPLFTKIIWWIPIFAVLVAILYTQLTGAVLVALAVAIISCMEFVNNRGYKSRTASLYLIVFLFGVAHLGLWFVYLPEGVMALAAVSVVSVLSDVVAFFMGNYLGKRPLPRWINNRKSWEGVAGQLLGAIVGGLLAGGVLGVFLPWPVIIAVGVASAVGDLINSIAKRSLGIKDWGQTIPGHGGMLDRLSSLSLGLAVGLFMLMLY